MELDEIYLRDTIGPHIHSHEQRAKCQDSFGDPPPILMAFHLTICVHTHMRLLRGGTNT